MCVCVCVCVGVYTCVCLFVCVCVCVCGVCLYLCVINYKNLIPETLDQRGTKAKKKKKKKIARFTSNFETRFFADSEKQ